MKLKGIDEIHIGLNDLHLSQHKKFMFELYTDGTVDEIVSKLKKARIKFGIGGVGKSTAIIYYRLKIFYVSIIGLALQWQFLQEHFVIGKNMI